ncbi:RimJ/RimL family protein N-acetyltransferase [Blastococcus colisei]|uniref:RimJ/RimL family protein N-acetyltransferase n=1 Tax=Blastococcus colisei TaxID=1564162 RepID=A0A543PGK3_9ACTN|nr:GNAT family N-acetyltransferase [Blastococcus colisei]TQN43211.1 RimJ/RimL family protein N-acetyltransferase [Blastococcus colisei]
MELRHLTTARLRLDAVVPGDLEEHHALMSDPDVWRHLPSGRHTDPAQTMAGIEHSVGHWQRDGLGYWTARLLVDLAGTPLRAGNVVGTGGCALRVGTSWWNLYFRFTPAAWGHGLAAELVRTALDAARAADPDRPVIAYLLEHNAESRGRAERSRLSLVWRGPDAGNADPDAVRLVYADRPLDDELLARVAAHP